MSHPVRPKYFSDHEVQWRASVRSTGAYDSPSNRALDLVQPALQDRTHRSGAECRDRLPRLSQPDVVELQGLKRLARRAFQLLLSLSGTPAAQIHEHVRTRRSTCRPTSIPPMPQPASRLSRHSEPPLRSDKASVGRPGLRCRITVRRMHMGKLALCARLHTLETSSV